MRRRLISALVLLLLISAIVLPLSASAQSGGPFRVYLPLLTQGVAPVGATVHLVATADSYIASGAPDTNKGGAYFLLAGYDKDLPAPEGAVRTLIRFVLPSTGSRPITKAVLRVYYGGYGGFEDQVIVVSAHAAEGTWEEREVAWTNQPAIGGETFGTIAIKGAEPAGYREIDVTVLAARWLDGSLANHGLYLIGPETSGSDAGIRAFLSRETASPPELVVQFQ